MSRILRVRVYPKWVKRSQPPKKQIIKASGLRNLMKKLGNVDSRSLVVSEINMAFASLDWSGAVDRVDVFEDLVEKQVGTRPARMTSWGKKFDANVRALCKKASISRGWYIMASVAKQQHIG